MSACSLSLITQVGSWLWHDSEDLTALWRERVRRYAETLKSRIAASWQHAPSLVLPSTVHPPNPRPHQLLGILLLAILLRLSTEH